LTDKKLTGVQNVEVKTQYRNIDVLILVTDQSGKQWAVIVENKMHTREHSKRMVPGSGKVPCFLFIEINVEG